MSVPVYSTKLFAGAAADGGELFSAPSGHVIVLVDVRIGALVSTTPGYVRFVDDPAQTIGWANYELVGGGNFGLATARWRGRQVYNPGDAFYLRTNIGSSFLRLRLSGYTLTTP